jgi:hypothetical protein
MKRKRRRRRKQRIIKNYKLGSQLKEEGEWAPIKGISQESQQIAAAVAE